MGVVLFDYLTSGVLVLFVFTICWVVIAIHGVPHLMAQSRKHPHQDAIDVSGRGRLFKLHAIWPFPFIWATLNREDRGRGIRPVGIGKLSAMAEADADIAHPRLSTAVLGGTSRIETRGQWYRCLQLSIVLAAAATQTACNGSKNEYIPPPPPTVRVAQPLVQPVTSYFELNGNTAAFNSVDIQARVQGFLDTIDYRDGDFVKQGIQLFSIQRDTYAAQRDQAQASLTSANAAMVERRQEYDRQQDLLQHEVTTQANVDIATAHFDEAKADILNAQAALQLAEINLGYTRVLAPFDGVVSANLVDVGALVGVDGPTKLATIVQIDPIYVYFNVTEPQVLEIKRDLVRRGKTLREIDLPNVPVELGLQGEDGYPHKGKLDYTAPQIDPSTGTLQVRGVLDNKDHAMLPGLFARVRVPIGHRDGGIFVRDDSIGTNQQGNYVLVLGKDDVVEQRQVKTGQRQGQLRVIEEGLNPQDWVVAEGIQRAIPGAKVAPEKVKFDAGEVAAAAPPATVVSRTDAPAPATAEAGKP